MDILYVLVCRIKVGRDLRGGWWLAVAEQGDFATFMKSRTMKLTGDYAEWMRFRFNSVEVRAVALAQAAREIAGCG